MCGAAYLPSAGVEGQHEHELEVGPGVAHHVIVHALLLLLLLTRLLLGAVHRGVRAVRGVRRRLLEAGCSQPAVPASFCASAARECRRRHPPSSRPCAYT